MTTHEKTRLIELLCSGDKLNILMAKEICEQQGLIEIIKEVSKLTLNFANFIMFNKLIFGINMQDVEFQEASFQEVGRAFKKSESWYKKESNYYSKHLQSSD